MDGFPYDLNAIENNLGPTARDRARVKRSGGDSAAKGYRFEISVALRLLLRFASYYAAREQKFPKRTWFWEQPMGFVDDLLIFHLDQYLFYQIKTGKNIKWRKDRATLRRDFRRQNALMSALKLPSKSILVVDSREEKVSLIAQQTYTSYPVMYISPAALPQLAWYDTEISGHIAAFFGNDEIAEAIIEPSLVYNVCRAFKSAWDCRSGRGSLPDFVRDASDTTFGLLRETPYREYDDLLREIGPDFDAELGLIGRCLIVLSKTDNDTTILPFERLDHVGKFLELLRNVPGSKTIDDIFKLKDWWDGEGSN